MSREARQLQQRQRQPVDGMARNGTVIVENTVIISTVDISSAWTHHLCGKSGAVVGCYRINCTFISSTIFISSLGPCVSGQCLPATLCVLCPSSSRQTSQCESAVQVVSSKPTVLPASARKNPSPMAYPVACFLAQDCPLLIIITHSDLIFLTCVVSLAFGLQLLFSSNHSEAANSCCNPSECKRAPFRCRWRQTFSEKQSCFLNTTSSPQMPLPVADFLTPERELEKSESFLSSIHLHTSTTIFRQSNGASTLFTQSPSQPSPLKPSPFSASSSSSLSLPSSTSFISSFTSSFSAPTFIPLFFPFLHFYSTLPFLLLFFMVTVVVLPPPASALPPTINVGAVFAKDRIDHEIAFRLAIKRINVDRVILPHTQLVPKIEHIQAHDSFHGNKKVCGLLQMGVVAIFDPFDGHISHHIQSICDAKDIPHIETRWEFKNNRNDPESINLFPKTSLLTKAYVDIVKAWNWEHFAIVYENSEGLFRLQDFFKEAEARNWKIKLHQFEFGKPYRDTFWKIKEEGELNIILDVKNENIFRALKHAQQVGLITEAHSYLITHLDLHMIDLEDFKFGKTRITAFSLINSNTEEHKQLMVDWKKEYPNLFTGQISTEAALLYDGVSMLAIAMRDLDHSQSIQIQQVNCEDAEPWAQGSSLINFMRPVNFTGLTGYVGFDDLTGARSKTALRIVTVRPTGLEEIGSWQEGPDSEKRLNINYSWDDHYASSALQNKTLIITTVINKPYTMDKDSLYKRTGNDRFEGYAIDLIAELAKILHFKYEFRLVKDGAYGRPDKNGTWNGMMGELIRGEADLAVADLTITSKRESAVDFTHPFMNTGISILFKKPTKKVTSLFSFLSPFSYFVWMNVLCAYIGVSSILFVVGRLSPYEWENPHPCRQEGQVLENSFSLSNSFWFTIGSLMQQASDLTPKAMSTRTIAAIWYFFTLIMIASYTANLAAFLTVEKIVYPIENAKDLAAQEKIKYGCLESGSTASFFSESNLDYYKVMWNFMTKHADEVFMKSNEEGRRAVEERDGTYAFLMESASIEFTVERECNLTQIGGLLDSKGYGIATAKDSPYRVPLSQAILQLQESGDLLMLKERWWKQKKGGGQCAEDNKKGSGTVMPLKIDNVGGVFVVLLGGLSFSLFVVILEFLWRSRTNLKQESVCEEIIHDLKFALMCQSSSKYVNNTNPEVPNSPFDSKSHQHSRIEYYPAAHFRRGGGHYPPVGQSSEPYTVLAGSLATGLAGKTTASQPSQKRPGYCIGPSNLGGGGGVSHPPTTIYSGSSTQTMPTPKSRCSSRLSLAAVAAAIGSKQSFPAVESEVCLEQRNTMSTGQRVSSVYQRGGQQQQQQHSGDDFKTLVSSSSEKALAGTAISSISGRRHQQQQQSSSSFSSRHSAGHSTTANRPPLGSLSKSGSSSIVRLNGSRVLLSSANPAYPSASSGKLNTLASQSNSCSDLVLREVMTKSNSGNGGGGQVHRVRSGSSMRSMGKISLYSAISLEDDLTTNSIGELT